jgi:DNA polymerase-3 subunit delta'
VWADLVGQEPVVAVLRAAAAAAAEVVRGEAGTPLHGMTHAWLFTGPPGSGRSIAARAFAAALECPNDGCGHCDSCHQALAGTHADVAVIAPEGLSIKVEEARAIVMATAKRPTHSPWQVTLIEDADRLTDQAANALLKAIEEPPPSGVVLLCAPSLEDVLPTIRSRCRVVPLVTPAPAAVRDLLELRAIPEDRPEPGGPVNSHACVIAAVWSSSPATTRAAASAAACSCATTASCPTRASKTLTGRSRGCARAAAA